MRVSGSTAFLLGVAVAAIALLVLNSVAADAQPMARFVVAVGVAVAVVAVVHRLADSSTG